MTCVPFFHKQVLARLEQAWRQRCFSGDRAFSPELHTKLENS